MSRRDGQIQTTAWFNEEDDTIRVKIGIRYTEDGIAKKKGIILKLTEEMLICLAEGQEYPEDIPVITNETETFAETETTGWIKY